MTLDHGDGTAGADSFPRRSPGPPASPRERRAGSSCPATAGGSRSCAPPPAPTGRRRCGCLTSRPAPSAARRTRSTLLAGGGEQLTDVERARRERMREGGAGITAFALDEAGRTAVFALSSAAVRRRPGRRLRPPGSCPRAGAGVDPRPSPDGDARRLRRPAAPLHVVATDGSGARASPSRRHRTLDLRARRLRRGRGAGPAPRASGGRPTSDVLLVERVDVGTGAGMAHRRPRASRAPAGRAPLPRRRHAPTRTCHALAVRRRTAGVRRCPGTTRRTSTSSACTGRAGGPPSLQVLTRRQERAPWCSRSTRRRVPRGSCASTTDPAWVDVVPGDAGLDAGTGGCSPWRSSPTATRCCVGRRTGLAGQGLQVRRRAAGRGRGVLVQCTQGLGEDRVCGWTHPPTGGREVVGRRPARTRRSAGRGVLGPRHLATRTGRPTTYEVPAGRAPRPTVRSYAEDPGAQPAAPCSRRAGAGHPDRGAAARPAGMAGGAPLPVLLDPYGGPHHAAGAQRRRAAICEPQWWADQGFAWSSPTAAARPGHPVVGARGPARPRRRRPSRTRSTPCTRWRRRDPGVLDLDRVAIRGWSFGGYLAALAVLRRPDVFHAAVAGAPVTDWRLYDTAYTERYLGAPGRAPGGVRRGVAGRAGRRALSRPLLVIHGLADDNVVAAHSLRLSSALLAAGRPHTFLPLSGVTHMTPQEVVAENLLLLQLEFLRRSLALGPVSLSGAQDGR